jgi:hypothetical protein
MSKLPQSRSRLAVLVALACAVAPAFAADAPAAGAEAPASAAAQTPAAKPAGKRTRRPSLGSAEDGPAVATSAPDRPAAKGAKPGAKGQALDRLDLDTTQITGNRELPKVMVVVPWKKSDIGDLVGKPVNSLVDEALEPVDREVFRREVDYYGALAPDRPASRSETPVTPGPGSAKPEK